MHDRRGSFVAGHRPQNGGYTTTGGPDQTVATVYRLASRPLMVRLFFHNESSEPTSIDAASVAVSADLGNGLDPIGASGTVDEGLWRRVGFGGGGRHSSPLSSASGDVHSITIPANHQHADRPVIVMSDWVPVPVVPGSRDTGAWLFCRAYATGRLRFSSGSGAPEAESGVTHLGFFAGGNAACPPWAGHFLRRDGMFAHYGVQYVTDRKTATVVAVGDSIMHAVASAGALSGFVARACALVSTPSAPIEFFNEGFTGRKSEDFFHAGHWALEMLRPHVMVVQVWSSNDPRDGHAADLAYARAISLGDTAIQRGCVPVFVGPAPVCGRMHDLEAIRRGVLDRVRDLSERGHHVLDLDAIWGADTNPNTYRTEYDSGDGVHQNDVACQVAAELLVPLLRSALAR